MEKNNEIVLYKSQDGAIKVDVLFENETVWLTQSQMAELFGCSSDNVWRVQEKSEEEYSKYKEQQRQIEHLESIKELDEDLKRVKAIAHKKKE